MYHLLVATSLHPFAYHGQTYKDAGADTKATMLVIELLVRHRWRALRARAPAGCSSRRASADARGRGTADRGAR